MNNCRSRTILLPDMIIYYRPTKHSMYSLTFRVRVTTPRSMDEMERRTQQARRCYRWWWESSPACVLRSRYVARTPQLEARSPGRRSNVENAPHRRPASHAHFPYTARNFENAPVTRRSPASSALTPRRAFALCRHIAGLTQACN